jgi:hypothetical protein
VCNRNRWSELADERRKSPAKSSSLTNGINAHTDPPVDDKEIEVSFIPFPKHK